MALTKCPDCQGDVSSTADRCPHCGRAIARGFLGRAGTERAFNVGCLVSLPVMVALVLLGMCSRMVG
jgi:predicted amidophosphoribosyltransferase